jgi:hypothetical protein
MSLEFLQAKEFFSNKKISKKIIKIYKFVLMFKSYKKKVTVLWKF